MPCLRARSALEKSALELTDRNKTSLPKNPHPPRVGRRNRRVLQTLPCVCSRSDVSNVTLVVHFPETELAAFDDDAFRAQFEAMYKRALASGLDVPMANITILNITRGPAAGGSWNMTEESATEREYEYVNATGEYVEDATGEPVYARGRRLMNHDSDYSPNATYAGVRVHSVIEVESNQADEVVSQLGSFYSGRGDFFEIFEPMASAYGRALLRRTTSDNYYDYPTTPSDAEIGWVRYRLSLGTQTFTLNNLVLMCRWYLCYWGNSPRIRTSSSLTHRKAEGNSTRWWICFFFYVSLTHITHSRRRRAHTVGTRRARTPTSR